MNSCLPKLVTCQQRVREVSLLDKLRGVPTCQHYRRWPVVAMLLLPCQQLGKTE
jgi:hypothetical protein